MSAIPPKHTPDAAPAAEDASETGMVALYSAASHAGAESFPVLKAFQDYIEAERAQARKRVMQLSIFFAVLMCLVVAGFLTAGIVMWRSSDARVDKLLEAVVAQKTAPAPAPVPVVQTSPAIEESVKQISRVTTELQSNLDKKLDGVSEIASKVNEKVATQNSEMEKLRSELKRMQEQSAKLQDELVTVKKEVAKKPEPPKAPVVAAPRPVIPVPSKPVSAAAPVIASAPTVAVAPAAVAPFPAPKPAAPKAETRDPRFPPAVKAPPVAPAGVTPPAPPRGMLATAIPLTTKNVGTIPWRVLIPE